MARKPLTLTVLGGGSYFTPSFVGTMCKKGKVFAGAEVRLHDLDADRVATVKAFCERFVRSRDAAMTFIAAPDLGQQLDASINRLCLSDRVGLIGFRARFCLTRTPRGTLPGANGGVSGAMPARCGAGRASV